MERFYTHPETLAFAPKTLHKLYVTAIGIFLMLLSLSMAMAEIISFWVPVSITALGFALYFYLLNRRLPNWAS